MLPSIRENPGRAHLGLGLALALALVLVAGRASGQAAPTVTVVMERLVDGGCSDVAIGRPDIYWNVTIDGTTQNNRDDTLTTNFPGQAIEFPFVQEIDAQAQSIGVRIEQKDRDDILFGDDTCDISPVGERLDLTLDLVTCEITGDVTGGCSESIFGSDGFAFRIDVGGLDPPSTPGTNVQCIHDPIWAQPGDAVTITATALDGALVPKTADSIEFWIDDVSGPTNVLVDASSESVTFTPDGDSFFYGCRVLDGTDRVFTGWRTSEVGQPEDATDRLVAVLYTGASTTRIDFALFADVDDYTASGNPPIIGDDPDFLADVGDAILEGYFVEQFYLDAQNELNFWIGLDGAQAEGFTSPPPTCNLTSPNAPLAEVRAVLHTEIFRDCATMNQFSTEAPRVGSFALRTLRHETGHRPFGLADEYCCDGGYFELPVNPNLHSSADSCEDDAPDLGRTAADCRQFTADPSRGGGDWHLSEPDTDDLMNDNMTPRAADMRRMNWFLDQCRAGDC